MHTVYMCLCYSGISLAKDGYMQDPAPVSMYKYLIPGDVMSKFIDGMHDCQELLLGHCAVELSRG